jgi:hypothetical protein
MDSVARRVTAAALAAALLALVVVGSAVRLPLPPALFVEPPLGSDPAADPYAPDDSFDLSRILGMEDGNDWSGIDLSWIGAVGGIVLLAAVVAVIVRLVRRFRRVRISTTTEGAADLDVVTEDDAMRIPVLLRGVEAARASLAAHADPGDAVVAAWLALEEAAHDSGLDRNPAETPAEFTVRVLAATGADARATTELLELYHGARFSRHVVTTADVDHAADCLGRIAASWPTPIEVAP